ncbi:MAG: hypothetical protein ACYCT1_20615 [Steroidobacteraceae bacterium]
MNEILRHYTKLKETGILAKGNSPEAFQKGLEEIKEFKFVSFIDSTIQKSI